MDPTPPSATDRYWFARLNASYAAGYSKAEQQAAIAYFQGKPILPAYLLQPELHFGREAFSKAVWENHLRALHPWLATPEVTSYFIQHLDDPNWPGFRFAWEALVNLGRPVILLLDEFIDSTCHDYHQKRVWEELKNTLLKSPKN